MIELGDASVADGAVLGSDRSTEETSAAKSPARRIKMIPVASLRQFHDRAVPLLLRHGDHARVRLPALPEVIPEEAGEAEIDGGSERADISLK